MVGNRRRNALVIIVLFVWASILPITISTNVTKPNIDDSINIHGKQSSYLGEPPEEEWNKTFDYGFACDVEQTTDGGYVLTGFNFLSECIWLIKTDKQGDEQWIQNLTDGVGCSIEQTIDEGYIIFSTTAFLIKTDSNGSIQWTKSFGEPDGRNYGTSVQLTSDKGYILTGSTEYEFPYNQYAWLIKTDKDGNEQWNKTFEGYISAQSVQQTFDGGYIIAGSLIKADPGPGNDPMDWLIKTDEGGNEQWNKTFEEGVIGESCAGVQQTSDGGYIVLSNIVLLNKQSPRLIKTDEMGNMQWNKTFVQTNNASGRSVQHTSDGGYIVAGTNFADLLVIKLDEYGNEQWMKLFGRGGEDAAESIVQTKDRGYIIGGATNSYGGGYLNAWLIKLAPEIGHLYIELKGGLGVNAVITNLDTTRSTDVNVELHVDGGFLGLINKTVTETISIPAGESETVSTGVLLGFGSVNIIATANEEEETAEGTQLFIFSVVS